MNVGSMSKIQANNPNPITNLRFTDKTSPTDQAKNAKEFPNFLQDQAILAQEDYENDDLPQVDMDKYREFNKRYFKMFENQF